MEKLKFWIILCAFLSYTCSMISFSHGVQVDNEPREQTPSRHLGEQLFYALFGVDNIPVCLVCDEEDVHPKTDVTETSNLASDIYFTLSVALCCFLMLLLCSGLLAIFIFRREAKKGKAQVGDTSVTTSEKTTNRQHLFATGYKSKAVYQNRRNYSPRMKRIRLMIKKRRNGTVQSLGVRLDNYGDSNEYRRKSRERPSKRSLEKAGSEEEGDENEEEDSSSQLDTLLCVKPNCDEHLHGKMAVLTKTKQQNTYVFSPNVNTAHKRMPRQRKSTSVSEDDSGWLFDLGTPQHSSTFVQSSSQSLVRCNHNGSSLDPFADTSSCEGLREDARVPSYTFTYHNSSLVPPLLQTPSNSKNPKSPEHHLSFEDSHKQKEQHELSTVNTSLDQTDMIDSLSSSDLSDLDSALELSNSRFSFLDSFQYIADRSSSSIRSVLERTTSSARRLVLQTGRGARYVGRKTVEEADRLRQYSQHGTRIIFAKTADGVHYVIECARGGRRCVVRKICAAEKSILCALAQDNLNWSVYDYMREFACYGNERSTVLHLVAAVLVKSSLDKARSYAKRHLDRDSDASTSVADDTVEEEQCIENNNLDND